MSFDRIELEKRKNKIHGLDNEEAIERQHSKGKSTAWERINMLVDEGSFIETNMHIEHRCTYFGMDQKKIEGDGVITGYGTIHGRCVCIYAQDFNVYGGSISEMNAKKIVDIQKKAMSMKVPLISLLDSGGARVQEGIQGLSGHGHIFFNNVKASGIIPQISAIMGTCAGGAAYSPALTDFIVMVDKTSRMFITGPKVVKAAIGQNVSMDELGGTEIHTRISGMADAVVDDDHKCIEYIKKLLGFLPNNYLEVPEKKTFKKKSEKELREIENVLPESPRRAFDIHNIIQCLVDDVDSVLEIKADYAPNIVTALARIGGYSVGIVANQSMEKAGCIDIDAADKAARFIRICDSFNIPLLNLVDVSGFYPGKEQEQKGIIRHGAKMLFAYSEAKVCKITVILRKAYGGAYLAMCSKELGADMVYAYPNVEMAVMGAEAAVDVLYKNEGMTVQELEENRKKNISEYEKQFLNPYEAAHMGYIDEIIEPRETRNKIVQILSMNMGAIKMDKVTHGNIPL